MIVPVSIAMSPALAWRVRVLAAQKNKSRSKFVREVLERVVEAHNADDRVQPDQQEAEADVEVRRDD